MHDGTDVIDEDKKPKTMVVDVEVSLTAIVVESVPLAAMAAMAQATARVAAGGKINIEVKKSTHPRGAAHARKNWL